MTNQLAFNLIQREGNRFRYQQLRNNRGSGGTNVVDVVSLPYTSRGSSGIGTVHHVAGRTPSYEQQKI